jgi:hypothetical protein
MAPSIAIFSMASLLVSALTSSTETLHVCEHNLLCSSAAHMIGWRIRCPYAGLVARENNGVSQVFFLDLEQVL